MKVTKTKRNILIIIFSLFLGMLIYILYNYLYDNGFFIPSYAIWKDKVVEVEKNASKNIEESFAEDFSDKEIIYPLKKIELKNKKLKCYSNKEIIFESNDNNKVQDFLWCDIDRDGENELITITWKREKYGKYIPFFIKDNDYSWSQHIFIYDYKYGKIVPIWKSSYISVNVKEMTYDKYNILHLLDDKGNRTRFYWASWGLSNLKNSKYDYDERVDKRKNEYNIILGYGEFCGNDYIFNDKMVKTEQGFTIYAPNYEKSSDINIKDKIVSIVYYRDLDLNDLYSSVANKIKKSDLSIVLVDEKDFNKDEKKFNNTLLAAGVDIVYYKTTYNKINSPNGHYERDQKLIKDIYGNELLIWKDFFGEDSMGDMTSIRIYDTIHGIKIPIDLENKTTKRLINNLDKFKYYTDTKDLNITSTIKLGKYEQDNNVENGPEDIEWYVISYKDEVLYLLSKYILNYKEFDRGNVEDVSYRPKFSESYINFWLNNNFVFESFDYDERNKKKKKGVTISCTTRYENLGIDYNDHSFMKADSTMYARTKIENVENEDEYWLLNSCDVNFESHENNRVKFVLNSGEIANDGFRNDNEKLSANQMKSNVKEKKGIRPFLKVLLNEE